MGLEEIYMKASVIIPCYNEGRTIAPIIYEVKRSQLVKEIIVVDSSSDPKTKRILYSIKGIKLINEKKMGKSAAIKSGVLNSKSNILVFIDGDLLNFKTYHVDLLIKELIDGNYDMVLGKRENEYYLADLTGFSIAYTGERAIYKHILLKNMEIFESRGYLLEPAINKVVFDNLRTGKVTLNGVGQIHSIDKTGIKGILKEVIMCINFVRFLGLKGLLFQMKYAKSL